MHRRQWIALSAAVIGGAGLALAQTTSTTTTTPVTTSTAAPAVRRPPSPAGTAATQVGGTWSAPDKDGEQRYSGGKWIEVTYSRPILRGRSDVFGKGAEYGKKVLGGAPVWRAGANQTTKLKTEVPLEIGGKRIAPGEYDLFVDLKENGWTLIVSTQPTQEKYDPAEKAKIWGSYGYDTKFDVVRVPMTMMKPAVSIDQFTIGFADMSDRGGKLAMAWGQQAAVVPFTVGQ
ncbi:MAG: DUF2911 domain-containing protein [Acidobacteria bacterium]|nr:DUF2911 domain-containing protein [Acidobacteriota bacterium]MCA1612459.1 DUF2911 domain-containing protein [Acidobacteriota bacterium]MCA1617473.1 DUF2911 domain-containing protein [Acidobacteriota bacterium]